MPYIVKFFILFIKVPVDTAIFLTKIYKYIVKRAENIVLFLVLKQNANYNVKIIKMIKRK